MKKTFDFGEPRSAGIVIIGFAEALSAPEVAWSLTGAGYQVVAFGRRGSQTALRASRHVTLWDICPPESDIAGAQEGIRQLLDAIRAKQGGRPSVLLPLDDASVWLCRMVDLGPSFRLAGPTGENAALALDKWRQIEAARKAGFRVPPTRQITARSEIFGEPLPYPVVFKPISAAEPIDGRLSRGRSWFCSNASELEAAAAAWAEREPMLLQDYVEGVGEGLFGLAGDQGVIAWSAHRRLRMMNPQGSGSSACVSQEVEPDLRQAGDRLIAQTGWRGLFMIELLRDRHGQTWFMELNGRSWGSMALARRQGLEYPAWAVALALNPRAEIIPPPASDVPVVCRHLGRELIHLAFVLRGPVSSVRGQWPSRRAALFQFCRFRRRDRWYNWRRDDRRVFWTDLISTLRGQFFKPRKRP